MDNQILITKEGHSSLQKELDQLVEIKRPKLVERLSRARAEGDLSENSDYTNAKEELEFLDGRISELEDVLKRAKIVRKTRPNGKIGMGTKVEVKINGNEQTFNIVGEWEADPGKQKISHTSPLGQALLGRGVGEKVKVEAPAGNITYTIVKVS